VTLVISIIRCPDAVPPQTRRLTGGELSIGRGPENDWVLPDPNRVLSKRHCIVAYRKGGWQIADLSSNGTFYNREEDPIGSSRVQDLRDGDRLRLGNYELEMRVEVPAEASRDARGFSDQGGFGAQKGFSDQGGFSDRGFGGFQPSRGADPVKDPFGDDPFAPLPAPAAGNPFDLDPFLSNGRDGNIQILSNVALPMDFDPLALDPLDAPFAGPTQSDHTAAVADAFRPPAIGRLPDDWDLDFNEPMSAPQAPPVMPKPAAMPIQTPRAAPIPMPANIPTPAPIPTQAAVAPPPPLPAPVDDFDDFAEPPAPAPRAPAVREPAQAPVVTSSAPQPAPAGDLLLAFLRGADLEDIKPADPVATMESLGAAFRAMVSGIRQTLIARAAVKSEFRIEQTMIRARGNNPLKFSPSDDDALAMMLGAGRRKEMPAAEAVTDALLDIRLHELATMVAMQSGVRALLKRLDPTPLREEGERTGGLLAAQRRARAFELFEKLHISITEALADDFDSVFGKEFARAYEQALREAADKEKH
jgi:type VI secretion system protein ImpI/type VI secretion system protein